MSSHQRYSDIEWESLQVRINLYKQMKEQLLLQMKLYHTQRKEQLAKLISESIGIDASNLTLYKITHHVLYRCSAMHIEDFVRTVRLQEKKQR